MDITSKEFIEIIVSGGVPAWNKWYLDHPGAQLENHVWKTGEAPPYPLIHIDLSDADFKDMKLDGIILEGACLMGSRFHRTSFRGARLASIEAQGAWFLESDFTGCDFTCAVLDNCDFSFSDLSMAKLFWAFMDNVNFKGAKLEGALIEKFPDCIREKAIITELDKLN